jgi:DUF4097 and DUF4098 domain-containing protein YvlB
MKTTPRHFALVLLAMAAFSMAAPALADDELREEFHKTFPLASDGSVRLDNVNGGIHILVWDREEAKLDAIKRAKTQEILDEAKIDVDAQPGSLKIKTEYPKPEKSGRSKNHASVEYTLTVPKHSRLENISAVNGAVSIENALGDVKASSVNGAVRASGLAGKAELSAVNGSVKAVFGAFSQPLSVHSVNGSVTVVLPPDSNGEISASTVNGRIHNDFASDGQAKAGSARHLRAKLGQGGPEIKLDTVNGGIRVERAGPGAEASR